MPKFETSSRMERYFQDELFSLLARGLVDENDGKYRLTDFAAKTLAASLKTYLTELNEDFKEEHILTNAIVTCGLHDRRMPSKRSKGLSFEQMIGTVYSIAYLIDGCNTPEEMSVRYIRENQGHSTGEWQPLQLLQ
jgi:hypothetical protein